MTEVVGGITLIGKICRGIRNYFRRPVLRFVPFEPSKDVKVWDWRNPPWHCNRKVLCREIENDGPELARGCTAILQVCTSPAGITPGERTFHLHWADTESTGSNSAPPVDIGVGPRRLDVAFTEENAQAGCWIAMPLALFGGHIGQAHLPPGRYECDVTISTSDGQRIRERLILTSPVSWRDLQAEWRGSA